MSGSVAVKVAARVARDKLRHDRIPPTRAKEDPLDDEEALLELVDPLDDLRIQPAPEDDPDDGSDPADAPDGHGLDTEGDPGVPSGGRPLADQLRALFETVLAHPLDHVRIHDGPDAAARAEALGAEAYTLGSDIVLGRAARGAHRDRVLAHELTHVVQADEGRLPAGRGVLPEDHPAEREAYANEARVLRELPRARQAVASGTAPQADAAPDDLLAEEDLAPAMASLSALWTELKVGPGAGRDALSEALVGLEAQLADGLRDWAQPLVAEAGDPATALLWTQALARSLEASMPAVAALAEAAGAPSLLDVVIRGADALPASGSADTAEADTDRIHDPDEARRRHTAELLTTLSSTLGVADEVEVRVGGAGAGKLAEAGAIGLMEDGVVYLDSAAYDPATPEGRGLLAHEVAHAAQAERPAPAGEDGAAAEAEADAFAASFAAGADGGSVTEALPVDHVAAKGPPETGDLGDPGTDEDEDVMPPQDTLEEDTKSNTEVSEDEEETEDEPQPEGEGTEEEPEPDEDGKADETESDETEEVEEDTTPGDADEGSITAAAASTSDAVVAELGLPDPASMGPTLLTPKGTPKFAAPTGEDPKLPKTREKIFSGFKADALGFGNDLASLATDKGAEALATANTLGGTVRAAGGQAVTILAGGMATARATITESANNAIERIRTAADTALQTLSGAKDFALGKLSEMQCSIDQLMNTKQGFLDRPGALAQSFRDGIDRTTEDYKSDARSLAAAKAREYTGQAKAYDEKANRATERKGVGGFFGNLAENGLLSAVTGGESTAGHARYKSKQFEARAKAATDTGAAMVTKMDEVKAEALADLAGFESYMAGEIDQIFNPTIEGMQGAHDQLLAQVYQISDDLASNIETNRDSLVTSIEDERDTQLEANTGQEATATASITGMAEQIASTYERMGVQVDADFDATADHLRDLVATQVARVEVQLSDTAPPPEELQEHVDQLLGDLFGMEGDTLAQLEEMSSSFLETLQQGETQAIADLMQLANSLVEKATEAAGGFSRTQDELAGEVERIFDELAGLGLDLLHQLGEQAAAQGDSSFRELSEAAEGVWADVKGDMEGVPGALAESLQDLLGDLPKKIKKEANDAADKVPAEGFWQNVSKWGTKVAQWAVKIAIAVVAAVVTAMIFASGVGIAALIAAAVVGAIAAALSYVIADCFIGGKEFDWSEFGLEVAFGAVGNMLGGAGGALAKTFSSGFKGFAIKYGFMLAESLNDAAKDVVVDRVAFAQDSGWKDLGIKTISNFGVNSVLDLGSSGVSKWMENSNKAVQDGTGNALDNVGSKLFDANNAIPNRIKNSLGEGSRDNPWNNFQANAPSELKDFSSFINNVVGGGRGGTTQNMAAFYNELPEQLGGVPQKFLSNILGAASGSTKDVPGALKDLAENTLKGSGGSGQAQDDATGGGASPTAGSDDRRRKRSGNTPAGATP